MLPSREKQTRQCNSAKMLTLPTVASTVASIIVPSIGIASKAVASKATAAKLRCC